VSRHIFLATLLAASAVACASPGVSLGPYDPYGRGPYGPYARGPYDSYGRGLHDGGRPPIVYRDPWQERRAYRYERDRRRLERRDRDRERALLERHAEALERPVTRDGHRELHRYLHRDRRSVDRHFRERRSGERRDLRLRRR
jgi:hypothetical protein